MQRNLTLENYQQYFQTLGLPVHATKEQITRAFRRLALKIHPDKRPTHEKEQANAEFIKLKEAQEILLQEKMPAHPGDITDEKPILIKRIDLNRNKIFIPSELPLDEEHVFYATFPFTNHVLLCDPNAILTNIFSAKSRYTQIFYDKKCALENLTTGEASLSGEVSFAIYLLQGLHMLPAGIIYTLKTTARTIFESYDSGNFELFIPLIKEAIYYKSENENLEIAVTIRKLITEIWDLQAKIKVKDISAEMKMKTQEKITEKTRELGQQCSVLYKMDEENYKCNRTVIEEKISAESIQRIIQKMLLTDSAWQVHLQQHEKFMLENHDLLRLNNFISQLDVLILSLTSSRPMHAQIFTQPTSTNDLCTLNNFRKKIQDPTNTWESLSQSANDCHQELKMKETQEEFLTLLTSLHINTETLPLLTATP